MAPTLAADTGWSVPTATAAFSGGLVVSALVGIPVGRLAGPVRAARGDDGRVGGGGARGGRDRHRADVRGVPRRLAAGRGGDGGHAVPARVRGADPLVGRPARGGADRAHAGRRADQHDLRPADGRAARRARLARHLPRAGAVLAVVTVPGHLWGLRGPWPAPDPPAHPAHADPGRAARSRPFVLLSRGAHRWRVHRLRRARGPGAAGDRARDVDDRGGVDARARRRRPGARPHELRRAGPGGRACGRARSACSPCAPRPPPCSASCPARRRRWSRRAMLAGAARGIFTLLQATAVTDRWGTAYYGRLNGVLSAPSTLATAARAVGGCRAGRPARRLPRGVRAAGGRRAGGGGRRASAASRRAPVAAG